MTEMTITIAENIQRNAESLIRANIVYGEITDLAMERAKSSLATGDIEMASNYMTIAQTCRKAMEALGMVTKMSQMDEDAWLEIARRVDQERTALDTLARKAG